MSEYVALLPAAFTAPLFWSPEAIGLLAYPTARGRLLKTAKVRGRGRGRGRGQG